ncbi:16352_t:CDS:2 [Funneliformis mosseae]|uniref:16352_t:CDS:1 n=1 Tax=Funneliformis mosseae TaxID=27381 RepID=A0A9N8W3W6_FUNMO|nr:16352_t:CDS:2 [Funneliformis mosseae]
MPVIQIWCGVCRDSGTMRILDLKGGYTSDQPLSLEQVYLYDTINDEWSTQETNNNSSNTTNVVVLVGVILGALAFGILLSVGGFLLCNRRRRKTQVYQVAIPTPRETKPVS